MSKRLAGRFGYPATNSFAVTFHADKIPLPFTWKKPSMIFCCSMSDLFHPDVAEEWIDAVLSTIKFCDWHTFFILTKRPELMLKWKDRLRDIDNVWIGVTVENQAMADQRIPILRQMLTTQLFISVEPILDKINILPLVKDSLGGIDWVICGGETGAKARPFDYRWATNLGWQCSQLNIPFFFKSYGSNSNYSDMDTISRNFLDKAKYFPK
jgi:protein gp37